MGLEHKRLSLDLIEEGRLLRDFNDEFFNLQSALMKHILKYGEKSKGDKAEITLKLKLVCQNPENGVNVAVTGEVNTKLPGRPTSTTIAIGDETKSGAPTLSCRDLGTSYDSPHQKLLDMFQGEPLSSESLEEED